MRRVIFLALAFLPIIVMAQGPKDEKGLGGQELSAQSPGQMPKEQGSSGQGMNKKGAYMPIIYTDDNLPNQITRVKEEWDSKVRSIQNNGGDTRGILGNLGASTLESLQGIGSGYVTSIVSMGADAIASLITRKTRLKEEWVKTVQAENTWSESIDMMEDVKDFYNDPSLSGALDPSGMHFNGIGCLRIDEQTKDTLFYVSCHIDPSKLYRIVYHSKFELVLDTLIVSPKHSNLPNSKLPLEFSFEERKDFKLTMSIKLTSSWITDAIELHNDEQLGEFTLSVAINKDMIDDKGFYRYVRKDGETPRFDVIGESFIVPRSYMGYRDNEGNYNNIWGTGQYKFSIELKESCDITDKYMSNWNEDRKMRKKMEPKQKSKNSIKNIYDKFISNNPDQTPTKAVSTFISSFGEGLNKTFGFDSEDEHGGGPGGAVIPK